MLLDINGTQTSVQRILLHYPRRRL